MSARFRCYDCRRLGPYRTTCECGSGVFETLDRIALPVLRTTQQAPIALLTATLDPLRDTGRRRDWANGNTPHAQEMIVHLTRVQRLMREHSDLIQRSIAHIAESRRVLEKFR